MEYAIMTLEAEISNIDDQLEYVNNNYRPKYEARKKCLIDQKEELLRAVDKLNKRKSTEIKDKNGDEIFFGDTLVFVDKWEWYKRSYGPKFYFADNERKEQLRKEYEAEPLEERLVENVQDYEWLLSSELQIYWEIKK